MSDAEREAPAAGAQSRPPAAGAQRETPASGTQTETAGAGAQPETAPADAEPDTIVIGAGLAGLVCTLELLRAGHRVLLVDRCHAHQVGGLAREAFGGMFMVDSPEQRRSRVRDSERLALEDWLRIAELDAQDEWPRRWAEQYVLRARDDVGGWLRELGVRFFGVVNWAERGNFGDGNSVPRFHLTWGAGRALVQAVWGAIEHHPRRAALQVRLRTRVTELVLEEGRVVGCRVVAEDPDQDGGRAPRSGAVMVGVGQNSADRTAEKPLGGLAGEELRTGSQEGEPRTGSPEALLGGSEGELLRASGAVVIASGGIGGNLELIRREWPTAELGSPPEEMLMGSHYYADGAMHEQARRAGGAVTHLRNMWNYADAVRHPDPQRERHGLKLIPPRSGLMLNPDGVRYGPVPVMPTFDAYAAMRAVCSDERKYAWLVCNWKIACRELDVSGSQHNPHLRERRLVRFLLSVLLGKPTLVRHFLKGSPDFVSAGSLGELARRMNEVSGEQAISAEGLEREVGRYDEAVARGKSLFNDDQLRRIGQLRNWRGDRLRTARFQRIADPKAMPLVAIRLQVMARKSLGGIQTDLGGRVLREDGSGAVPGLYAVGEAAGFGGGGMHGKRSLEGTFLGGCVFSGRLAAASIAGSELPLRVPPRVE